MTVVRDSQGKIVAAASIQPNSRGTFGRLLREKVAPNTALVKHIAGDKAGTAQAFIAAAEGVERFMPKQKALTLVTDNQKVAVWANARDGVAANSMIRRTAPEVFANMPEAQRPPGVAEALTPPNGKPLTTQEQLRRLNEIPIEERATWPRGTQTHAVTIGYERPLMALGNERLGKLVHPMHPDSYVGKFNSFVNPVLRATQAGKYVAKKVRGGLKERTAPKDVMTFPGVPKAGIPERVATVYRKNTLPADLRRTLATHEVEINAQFGEAMSSNSKPWAQRLADAENTLKKLDAVVVVSELGKDGTRVPAGLAAVSFKFKGHSADSTGNFPSLAQRQFKLGTAYLSNVISVPGRRGGGEQAVVAAAAVAKERGAIRMAFHTQNDGAAELYERLGRIRGKQTRSGAELPNLTETHVLPSTVAAKMLAEGKSVPEPGWMSKMPAELQQAIREKSGPELQRHLESLGDEQFLGLSSQVPAGVLLTSYNMKFARSPLQAARWQAQNKVESGAAAMGAGLTTGMTKLKAAGQAAKPFGQRAWKPVGRRVDKFKQRASALNSALNPYALPHGIEPGPVRGKLQAAGYAASLGVREGTKNVLSAIAVSSAAQAATGQNLVKFNDDELIRPFNGVLGSRSVGVYFPLTGTMVALWHAGSNRRGPWPLDENGLMPLARVSAPMTDPKGPKGAGFLSAARLAPFGEWNAGIRWFGGNSGVSALSAVSWRPMPFNLNVRGDVPVQKGATNNLSLLGSVTALMPSVSHAFYLGPGGAVIRTLHVTMGGSLQTAALSPAARASGYQAGNYYTLASNKVSGGTGLFFTLNPAYGYADPHFYTSVYN